MSIILAIGAHYDDIELGCGCTLLKHAEKGDKIIFAITSSDEDRTGDIHTRCKEQKMSAKIIGVSKILKFSYRDDLIHEIVGHLDALSPDIIFTQFEFDTHQDHKRASTIGQAVGRKKNIITFLYDSGSAYNFYPNIYSIIDWPSKSKLLYCYKSQIECGAINIDVLKKKSAYLGSLVSDNAYAEGLTVRRMIYDI